jgi:hypothetical protein
MRIGWMPRAIMAFNHLMLRLCWKIDRWQCIGIVSELRDANLPGCRIVGRL